MRGGRALPRALAQNPRQVSRLREELLRDDQTIKGCADRDPLDLARQARVTASAETEQARAALVLDGFVRDIPDKRGNPREVHHWAAPVSEGQPAWIELSWEKPQRLRQVQITFDSGFQRQLTLSAQEAQNVNLVRAAQPETVKDYRVTCRLAAGGDRTLAEVKGNFQRLNRHRFEAVEAQSVRVEIESTNGDRLARIFEIRCYA